MKPQNTDKVTARPWEAKPWTCHAETCIMHNNQPIAETSGLGNDVDLCEANAALIVKAVNEHTALVAVAEAAKKREEFYMLHPVVAGDVYLSAMASGLKSEVQIALQNLKNIKG